MKIKLNSKDGIPGKWDDVTFAQFLAMDGCKDTTDYLALFLKVERETLMKARIINLEEAILALKFLSQPMPNYLPDSIMGFIIPKNLKLETVCQYEDVKDIVSKIPPEGKLKAKDLTLYLDLCAVYAMPGYVDATQEQRDEFAKRFLNAPCWEVMAVGNFTWLKLIESTMKSVHKSPKVITVLNRFRLVMKVYRARMAFFIHSFSWKRKLHTKGMS